MFIPWHEIPSMRSLQFPASFSKPWTIDWIGSRLPGKTLERSLAPHSNHGQCVQAQEGWRWWTYATLILVSKRDCCLTVKSSAVAPVQKLNRSKIHFERCSDMSMPSSWCWCNISHNNLSSGLPSNVPTVERLPRRYTPCSNDVFALIKHQLSDQELSQPALLVWPGEMMPEVQAFWQQSLSHKGNRDEIPSERADALKALAAALQNYPQYGRAICFYKALANGQLPKVDARTAGFSSELVAFKAVALLSMLCLPEMQDPILLSCEFAFAVGGGRGWRCFVFHPSVIRWSGKAKCIRLSRSFFLSVCHFANILHLLASQMLLAESESITFCQPLAARMWSIVKQLKVMHQVFIIWHPVQASLTKSWNLPTTCQGMTVARMLVINKSLCGMRSWKWLMMFASSTAFECTRISTARWARTAQRNWRQGCAKFWFFDISHILLFKLWPEKWAIESGRAPRLGWRGVLMGLAAAQTGSTNGSLQRGALGRHVCGWETWAAAGDFETMFFFPKK